MIPFARRMARREHDSAGVIWMTFCHSDTSWPKLLQQPDGESNSGWGPRVFALWEKPALPGFLAPSAKKVEKREETPIDSEVLRDLGIRSCLGTCGRDSAEHGSAAF
jgi:hypothetical protein